MFSISSQNLRDLLEKRKKVVFVFFLVLRLIFDALLISTCTVRLMVHV